jgi:hypothetical protein
MMRGITFLAFFLQNRGEQLTRTLGVLSIGRVEIVRKGAIATQLAATIAIRYSAVRRQFGGESNKNGMCFTKRI